MLKYKAETIRQVFSLLNEIEVKGIQNANRVAVIANLLNKPEEDNNGTECKCAREQTEES